MNSAGRALALILLTAFLAGCRHRHQAAVPAAAQAPAVPLWQVANNVPPPYLTTPRLVEVNLVPEVKKSVPEPRKPVRHIRPRHVTIPASPEPAPSQAGPTPEQIASGVPTDISPIGKLSAAGESTNLSRRTQIADEIDSTQKGLDGIKRQLNKQEQTTVDQIRTFLEKAKQALNSADLDGAHTLVTKARVLLKEIERT